MAIFVSRSISASTQEDTSAGIQRGTDDGGLIAEGQTVAVIKPECDPWPIRARIRAFGPCTSRALDRPLPDITDSLAARILIVSQTIAHAHTNGHLKFSLRLVNSETIYNNALRDCLDSLKGRSTSLYWKASEELQRKPDTIEGVKNRLSCEFELFAKGHSSPRFFHFRNNVAYLYQQANGLKDGPSLS